MTAESIQSKMDGAKQIKGVATCEEKRRFWWSSRGREHIHIVASSDPRAESNCRSI